MRAVVGSEVVLLVIVVIVAALTSELSQWTPWELVGLLAVLVLGSDYMTFSARRFRISGAFLGFVLAMAVLGPAPATALGLAAAIVDGIRCRTRGPELLSNIVTYATFPLAEAQEAYEAFAAGGKFGKIVLEI